MSGFAYVVQCTFTDRAVRDEWLAWLRDEHVADVVAAGALSGHAIVLDGDELTCEVHYRFADRAAFDVYEREHAPRLREEGLTRFPLERGLTYARRTGVVAC